jgi:uncharacterized peroxidase-related enzyme
MTTFNVPTRDQVSANNQEIFDNLKSQIGMVPNLYATYAFSDVALKANLDYSHAFESSKSFRNKEVQTIYLAVSQANDCSYCLSAHTALGKMAGLSDEQIIDIRRGTIQDEKLRILADLAREITLSHGRPAESKLQAFFDAGYNKAQLLDLIGLVAVKTYSNYVHNITNIPVDFPKAKALTELTTA